MASIHSANRRESVRGNVFSNLWNALESCENFGKDVIELCVECQEILLKVLHDNVEVGVDYCEVAEDKVLIIFSCIRVIRFLNYGADLFEFRNDSVSGMLDLIFFGMFRHSWGDLGEYIVENKSYFVYSEFIKRSLERWLLLMKL